MSPAQTTHHGFRSGLLQLLPRHATFQVKLVIHQLTNVPLVHGEFGVKWRFSKVQATGGLLAKMAGRKSTSNTPNNSTQHLPETAGRGSVESRRSGGWTMKGRGTEIHEEPEEIDDDAHSHFEFGLQAPVINVVEATPVSESDGRMSVFPPTPTPGSPLRGHSAPLPATPSKPPDPSASSLSLATPNESWSSSERGMTPYVKLSEHTVQWEHTVELAVQMGVARDTNELLPNELKLQILQHVVPGDANAPAHPLLGKLTLNLAEYAGKGPITRRYLLRHSKTNALLKLTLALEHVAGAGDFVAPELRKGEIMAGVQGILLANAPAMRSATSLVFADEPPPPLHAPFAAARLGADDAHTTAALIDAIFNPVPTADPQPSPFTVYDPAASPRTARSVSTRSTASTYSASTHTTSSDGAPTSSSASLRPQRPWWRMRKSYHHAHLSVGSRARLESTADKYAALGLLGPDHPMLSAPNVAARPPFLSTETGSDDFVTVRAKTAAGHMKQRPPMLSGLTGSEGFINVTATPVA